MNIKKPKHISSERLILRPIVIEDLEVIQNYSIDTEWHRFLDFHTKESVEEFVTKAVNSPWEEHARFSIMFDNHMVGGVGLYIEMKEKRAEIGYSLSKNYWGKGIIPEAVTRVIKYGFEEMKLEKIFAQTDLRNTPSQAVMKKMNMTNEGTFRKHSIAQNKRRDIVYYSILKSEWENK